MNDDYEEAVEEEQEKATDAIMNMWLHAAATPGASRVHTQIYPTSYYQRFRTPQPVPPSYGMLNLSPWPWMGEDLSHIREAGEHWSNEPVVAYKTVEVTRLDPDTAGIRGFLPQGELLEAECHADTHQALSLGDEGFHASGEPAPGLNCSCGFYAWKDEETAVRERTVFDMVYRVELSGRVIEHDDAFRAEKMRLIGAASYHKINPEVRGEAQEAFGAFNRGDHRTTLRKGEEE